MQIKGSTVVITGGGRGIGREMAKSFAAQGANVALFDLNQADLDETARQCAAAGVTARGYLVNVTQESAVAAGMDAVVADFGGIDVLVNNAGVSLPNSAFQDDDSYESNWARTLDINLTSHSRLVRLCLPYLREAEGGGRIVNIASTEAIVATAGMTAYAASKAGVAGLTRSLAVELGRHGVTVNCICPGPILTGMTAPIPDEAKQTYAKRRVPLRRYGLPEEVAHITLSMCLPSASFLNGAVVPVDGGMTVRHT